MAATRAPPATQQSQHELLTLVALVLIRDLVERKRTRKHSSFDVFMDFARFFSHKHGYVLHFCTVCCFLRCCVNCQHLVSFSDVLWLYFP